jgi:hypothetical protein
MAALTALVACVVLTAHVFVEPLNGAAGAQLDASLPPLKRVNLAYGAYPVTSKAISKNFKIGWDVAAPDGIRSITDLVGFDREVEFTHLDLNDHTHVHPDAFGIMRGP